MNSIVNTKTYKISKEKNHMKKRYWEIDFLRGLAILMMVAYHLLWDVNYFYSVGIPLLTGFWKVFQVITASLFLFLVGVSLVVSNVRRQAPFLKYLRRGGIVFFYGLLISLVTRILFPQEFIIFGILHFIGVAIVLSYVFRHARQWNLLFGIGFILGGLFLKQVFVSTNWFLIFGIRSPSFSTLDYFPLFPWFGVVLLGLFFGERFYLKSDRNFLLKDYSKKLFIKQTCFLGKYSLLIYFLHQAILYGAFYVLAYLL